MRVGQMLLSLKYMFLGKVFGVRGNLLGRAMPVATNFWAHI